MRVTLVEDDHLLARAIRHALEDQGHAVDWIDDGSAAADFLRSSAADVIVLDVNLPGRDGISLLRDLRHSQTTIPVLMLTARSATPQRIEGLDAGADDYLTKPFDMSELLARIRALGRRRPQIEPEIERLGSLVFTRADRALRGPEGGIDLPRRELALFECLLGNRGRIVPREVIMEQLYGTGADIEGNAVDLLISRLRRKLDGTGVAIRTARGLGYMLLVAET